MASSSMRLVLLSAGVALCACAEGEPFEMATTSPFGTGLPTTTTAATATATASASGGEESGDGDGDEDPSASGDGDGDPTGDGDGDGDPTTGEPTTGDGDGDPTTTGDGDGDPTTGEPTTGDGDGDPTTGDGDGDPMMMGEVWVESFEEMAYPAGWMTGGDANWAGDMIEVHDGIRSARSGTISDSDISWAEVSVNFPNPGQIRFWYKVSSESNYDYLQFSIDGGQQDEWSGEVGWSQASYDVGAGNHTFRWAYDKDITVSNGDDRAWVDYVEFDIGTVNGG